MCSDIDNWDNFVYSNYIYEVAITTSLFTSIRLKYRRYKQNMLLLI